MEFALALPAMLALILWIITMGFTLYSQGVVTSAAREAARHIAINGAEGTAQVIERNLNLAIPGIDGYEHDVEYDNSIVQVTITCDYTPFADFGAIARLLGNPREGSRSLRSTAYFRNEVPGL